LYDLATDVKRGSAKRRAARDNSHAGWPVERIALALGVHVKTLERWRREALESAGAVRAACRPTADAE
jgi:transposase-like protein